MQVRFRQDARIFETLGFGEIKMFEGWSGKLLPAGHVLGSAQLLYEASEGTLLYTGDAAFPLSDHADYIDLLNYVEAVRPHRVLTLHGFAQEFARDLRERGVEAWALTGANQLEFSISMTSVPATNIHSTRDATMEDSGFNRFCHVCESVRSATGKLEKVRRLAEYLCSLDDRELPLAAVWLTGRAFPQRDPLPLNLGGAVIRRALLAASGLTEMELRAISRRHNDAGMTTAEAMQAKPGSRALAITEIGEIIERLRAARGPVLKTELLANALMAIPAAGSGYLIRILTGDLRIGLKEGLLEDAIARAFDQDPASLREAHMLLGDIGRAAQLARDGRLSDAELTLFQPVRCMLASPEPDSGAVWRRLGGNGVVWIEDKLDGIRAQIHCVKARSEIYSRDLRNITDTFPEIALAARRLERSAVFDGEILAWDGGRALPFFELQKRLGRREPDLFLGGQIPVAFVVFDLLLLDDTSLLKTPLAERRRRLDSLTLEEPLLRAVLTRAFNPEEIEAAFLAARERGNEGLMAKDPSSLYTPGRRGLSWIKLKKDFSTLDVAVVAVEYGHGRRNKVLSDYTFAVRDELNDTLLPIGKAYSGLTDREIADLTARFINLAISRRGNRIEVEPAIVIEVTFDSIQPSDRHASGLALRFPRIKRVRWDKTVRDVDTLTTARRLAGIDEGSNTKQQG